jgi:hypothetical protein
MTTPFIRSIRRLIVPALCLTTAVGLPLFVQAPVFAQAPASGFVPPRLKDGHPNLQGLWKLSGGYGPPSAAANASGYVLPKFEYLPTALEKKRELLAKGRTGDLVAQCVTASVPRATLEPPYPMVIVQDGAQVVILHEFAHDFRIIPVDGSPHPKNFFALNGDSRGRWDGDTLVVDVTNFSKGIRWLHMGGDFLDENEHAVERYTLVDPDTILYEVTIEDPTLFEKPWVGHVNLLRQPKDDQIIEGACREGERDIQHYTQGTAPEAK